jgi:hypothetical protein
MNPAHTVLKILWLVWPTQCLNPEHLSINRFLSKVEFPGSLGKAEDPGFLFPQNTNQLDLGLPRTFSLKSLSLSSIIVPRSLLSQRVTCAHLEFYSNVRYSTGLPHGPSQRLGGPPFFPTSTKVVSVPLSLQTPLGYLSSKGDACFTGECLEKGSHC